MQDSWIPPTLQTSSLLIRPFMIEDANSVFKYASNPNVSKHTLWEPHKTLRDSKTFINGYAFELYKKQVPEPLAIALIDSPAIVIGSVGCFWVSKAFQCMELAFALAQEHWGKGYTAEASRAVIQYCFDEFKVERMQSRCKTENTASARVMEKLGMKLEGTLRSAVFYRNKFSDMHCYSILRSEWTKSFIPNNLAQH